MLPITKKYLKENNFQIKILGIIEGKKKILTEIDVRVLQNICKNLPDEDFENFKRNHIIYDGLKRSCRKMVWTKSGYFDEPFTCGLFEVNSKLSRQLIF